MQIYVVRIRPQFSIEKLVFQLEFYDVGVPLA